jgi:hypothetical protein
MFQVGEWIYELIISIVNVLKFDVGDLDESLFQDEEWPFQRIFYILGIEISDFKEVV